VRTAKILVLCVCVFATSLGAGVAAPAEEWPTKPISIYIGFPPGGPADIIARIYAPYMSKELGVPVVVVNKPGATGGVALEFVANSKPDGYTLQENSFGGLSTQPLLYHANFTHRNFTYILGHTGSVYAFLVKKETPWKDFREWVDYGRKNPGIKFGTHGPSNPMHVIMLWIAKRENLKILYATFKGDTDCFPAILGDHVDLGMAAGSQAPLIEAGKLRTLLQLTGDPADAAKVPSLGEVYPDFPIPIKTIAEAPTGLFGPKGIPAPIVQKLNRALKKGIYSEEYARYLKQNRRKPVLWEGEEVLPKLETAAEGYAAFLKEMGVERK